MGPVSMKFVDGETVSISIDSVSGRYLYSEMGMADGRNKKPTKQWELLREFARYQGMMTWSNNGSSPKNQKRCETLRKTLQRFFRIAGDPILLTDDKKGWYTQFSLKPDF